MTLIDIKRIHHPSHLKVLHDYPVYIHNSTGAGVQIVTSDFLYEARKDGQLCDSITSLSKKRHQHLQRRGLPEWQPCICNAGQQEHLPERYQYVCIMYVLLVQGDCLVRGGCSYTHLPQPIQLGFQHFGQGIR